MHKRILTEMTLTFTTLASENMAAIGLLAFDRTRTGYLETLLSTGICLHLRHRPTPELIVGLTLVWLLP